MAKTKFVLTHDLVKVEPEPEVYQVSAYVPAQAVVQGEPSAAAPTPANSGPAENSTNVTHSFEKHPEKNLVNEASRAGEGSYESAQSHGVVGRGDYAGRRTQKSSLNAFVGHDDLKKVPHNGVHDMAREAARDVPSDAVPDIIRDQFNLKIDRDIKRDFRIWCLRHHQSMTEALEDALRFYMMHKGDH